MATSLLAGEAKDLPGYSFTSILIADESTVLYRGHRRADHAPVTIKTAQREYPAPRDVTALRHEHAILKDLDLPGVVKVLGLEQAGNGLALIMEDLHGQPLREILGRGRLDWATCLEIALAVTSALGGLHEAHIIHKGVAPPNIILDEGARAITLINFGLATSMPREDQRPRGPSSLEGALAYISPEQTGRMGALIDHRTDFYSLGVTLYEMLTGALPFASADPMEIVHGHLARTPAPPSELVPEIPAAVSAIVMKLLAKAAEDRYQRAYGLKADLEACLERRGEAARLSPFPLGRRDMSGELRLPQRLYGRAREVEALLSAWSRARGGNAELVLIAGYAGVGKSALVNEVRAAIARERGYFVGGKFDQLNRTVPYAPVLHALRDLVRQIREEGEGAEARFRRALSESLGPSAPVLVELIPELARCLGPQPSAPALGPSESQNRFTLAFQSFLRVVTTAEHPLVIFLDDLQWADPASLKLLEILLTSPDRGYLLVLGAFRDNEVDAAHPLSVTMSALRKAGAPPGEIRLAPLAPEDVQQIIAHALSADAQQVAPLAQLVFDKTAGNPFFIHQLLRALHKDGLITFDPGDSAFRWDLRRIEAAPIEGDVIAFMASKLKRLHPAAQRVLKLAACIGYRFDLETLAIIDESTPREAAAALKGALREGLVIALSDDRDRPAAGEDAAAAPAEIDGFAYRFLHDRVQQAAYSLIEGGRERDVHLRIGRLMWRRRDRLAFDEALFDVVNHLNFGAALIDDEAERLDVARLNLTACRKAKAAGAYAAAMGYAEAGMALLPEGSFARQDTLAFDLHLACAECAALTGAFAATEALFDTLLAHARSDLERAEVHNLRMILYGTLGRFEDALRVGRAGLALLGLMLPEGDDALSAAVEAEHAEVRRRLGARRIDDLLGAPEIEDPHQRALLTLLSNMSSPAFLVSRPLYTLITVKQAHLSLAHGHSDLSAYGYMLYGFTLATVFGEPAEARAFGTLSLALNERFNNVDLTCKLNFLFGEALHFFMPLREALTFYARAYHAGLASGDFPYLSYTCRQALMTRLALGDDLGEVRADADRYLTLMARTKDALSTAAMTVGKQMVASLEGRTSGRASLSDTSFDEPSFVRSMEASGFTLVLSWYAVMKLALLVLEEDYEGALPMVLRAEETKESAFGLYHTTEVPFYACLALLALPPAQDTAVEATRAAMLAEHRERLEALAEGCPDNYRYKHLLVLAEAARRAGDARGAAELYDRAIAAAQEASFVHHEALAAERCARFYLTEDRVKMARVYMTDAYYGYLRWGATAKAAALASRYPHLILQADAGVGEGARWFATLLSSATSVASGASELLDASTVLKAAQAIAGERVLDKVLDQLMRLLIASAGAQRGLLLLARDGQLTLEASISVDPDVVQVGPSRPLTDADRIAQTIVYRVAATLEPVILGDASRDEHAEADAYLAAHRPRSILCMAMTYQGRLTGIVYLENNAVRSAFTAQRIEICSVLAAHAAIAIENALLMDRVEAATAALTRSNEALEQEVARRTEELRGAYAQLERELIERRRFEEERTALQEEIIRAQKERLLELSTPLIPITDHIMVMPLIGTMDAERAGQVLRAALEGAAARRARVIIIDITGVKQVDAAVASTLMSTTKALRLLGTQAIVTGIRPDVARALLELGIDLGAILVKGSLKSGIAYALGETR